LVIDEIAQRIASAANVEKTVISAALVRSKDVSRGDYAFPCFVLAKEWKSSPPECAKRLAASIELPAGIQKVEAAGAYLNFFIDRAAYAKEVVTKIRKAGFDVGKGAAKGQSVIVEYSSPNIAKPFHIGHLRATLIGLALDNVFEHLGYTTISINHLGDWGTQFGFVFAGCELWGKPEKPEVDDLVKLYQRASALRKAQDEKRVAPEDADKPDVNQMARDYFKRLEAGDAQARAFWEWCLDVSMQYFRRMYERLGIQFDYYTGESFYQDKLAAVERVIKESGILQESRGALGVELEEPLGYVRIFTEDGRSLYITRDIAAADYRVRTYQPHKMLYVVGAPQILHFRQLVGVLRKLNHPAAELIVHIPFGYVPGISSRHSHGGGDRISLREFLGDAHQRALEAYRSEVAKRPADLDEETVAEGVGLGAVFFDYLCRSNIKEFHFDWDQALNFHGDTGPYIQYALARINSIAAKAAESGISCGEDFDAASLGDEEAYQLVSQLACFEEVLQKVEQEYEPCHLAVYLLDLAKTFSSIYRKLRVVGEENQGAASARLALFEATKYVLHTGLRLLGVPPLERM
jgi:arginyl-tRNA synthetase